MSKKVELSRRIALLMPTLATTLSVKDYDAFVDNVFDAKSFESLSEDEQQLIVKTESLVTKLNDFDDKVLNEFDEEERGIIATQRAALENAIVSIEGRVVNSVTENIFTIKNEFESTQDVLKESERIQYVNELSTILATFYSTVIPLNAALVMSARLKEFGMTSTFSFNAAVKRYVKEISEKSSQSHVDTILNDLRVTIKRTYDDEVERIAASAAEAAGRSVDDADLIYARKRALEGASRERLLNEIKKEYNVMTRVRAKAIARTETNRAFTRSQYEADVQFIKNNNLEGRAYKKWTTRSDNPCPICQALEKNDPIPFNVNFADLGDELQATYVDDKGKTKVVTQLVNFEELSAGNAHVNCSCRYILIIKDE